MSVSLEPQHADKGLIHETPNKLVILSDSRLHSLCNISFLLLTALPHPGRQGWGTQAGASQATSLSLSLFFFCGLCSARRPYIGEPPSPARVQNPGSVFQDGRNVTHSCSTPWLTFHCSSPTSSSSTCQRLPSHLLSLLLLLLLLLLTVLAPPKRGLGQRPTQVSLSLSLSLAL